MSEQQQPSDDPIYLGIQSWLDEEGSNWICRDYVCVVGMVRVAEDGSLEYDKSLYTTADQAPWSTKGLIDDALEMTMLVPIDEDQTPDD